MASKIIPPFELFKDIDGEPLEAGYVYVGAVNSDPESSPVTVYWDASLTVVATQPLRTISGYISNNGSPANIYTAGNSYSITVRNKNGSLVYTNQNVASSLVRQQVDDYAELKALNVSLFDDEESVIVTDLQRGGIFVWRDDRSYATEVTGNPDESKYVPPNSDTSGASGVWIKLTRNWHLNDSEAVLDGTTDDQAAVQAYVDYVETQGGGMIFCDPSKTVALGSAVTLGASGTEVFLGSCGKNGVRFKALSAFTGGMFIELAGGLIGAELEGFDDSVTDHNAVEVGNGSVTNPLVYNERILNIGGWYKLYHTDYEYDNGVFDLITSNVPVGHSVMDMVTSGSYAPAASPRFSRLSFRNPDSTRTVGQQKKSGLILGASQGAVVSGLISNFDICFNSGGVNKQLNLDHLEAFDLRSTPSNNLWEDPWTATTVFATNAYVKPTAANANGHFYIATVPPAAVGQTGGTEPVWPTAAGGTVVDGDITWTEVGESVQIDIANDQQVNISNCETQAGIAGLRNTSNANIKLESTRLVAETMAILNTSGNACTIKATNCLLAGDIELGALMSFIGEFNLVSGDTLGQVPDHENSSWSSANYAFESGKGVDFSDNTVANASSQVLDNYATGDWTPGVANLTEVGGSATIDATFRQIGDLVIFKITVTPVTNTSATAGSTYFGAPGTVGETSTCIAVGENGTTSLGVGRVDTTGNRIYVPSWTTETGDVIITGSYIAG